MTTSWGNRVVITFAIVLIILLALALYGYLTGGWENEEHSGLGGFILASAQTQPVPCVPDEQTREQIRSVMLEALDEALENQFIHVFEVWLRDERGQPGRARTGVDQGVKAYLGARKSTLEWMPPTC